MAVCNKFPCALPSDLLGIEDEYTSYCFNEACATIMYRLQNGEKIEFKAEAKNYKKPSDLYAKYGKKYKKGVKK